MRIFWGAFDVSYNTPEYTGAALVSGGPSAAPAVGVGVRRASLRFSRLGPGAVADDDADMHFDFLNITGGSPDDTWTTTDYTDLETLIEAWWATTKAHISNQTELAEIRWYRVGTGVVPPNYAQRVTTVGVAGSSSSPMCPPQVACSITMRTARRRNWGRTYIPSISSAALDTQGQLTSTVVDDLAGAAATLLAGAATKQFYGGVTSLIAGSFFATEHVEVDSILDVIRRRRWKRGAYRAISS